MFDELNIELNKLEEKAGCSKNFWCTNDPLKDPCQAKYNAISDLMECKYPKPKTCEFSAPFSSTYICSCELIKLIAINFKELKKKKNHELID
jgi:hypothetical protein